MHVLTGPEWWRQCSSRLIKLLAVCRALTVTICSLTPAILIVFHVHPVLSSTLFCPVMPLRVKIRAVNKCTFRYRLLNACVASPALKCPKPRVRENLWFPFVPRHLFSDCDIATEHTTWTHLRSRVKSCSSTKEPCMWSSVPESLHYLSVGRVWSLSVEQEGDVVHVLLLFGTRVVLFLYIAVS